MAGRVLQYRFMGANPILSLLLVALLVVAFGNEYRRKERGMPKKGIRQSI